MRKAGRRIHFTGSTRVGGIIAQTGAKYLKPVLLEPGGKAPFVVVEDADVDWALSVAKRSEERPLPYQRPHRARDEAQMPFGGVKASGYGRFGGTAGIREFPELRWITIQDGPLHYPI